MADAHSQTVLAEKFARHDVLYWLAVILLPLQLGAWWVAGRLVRGTSLRAAWFWSIPALGAWSLLTMRSAGSAGLTDHLGYSAVVQTLAPFVAVLGARRPGAGPWNWFVVLPMLVVLHWPATASLLTGSIHDPFELAMPTALGCGLVTVMGVGNYFGTRQTLPAAAVVAALFLVLYVVSRPVDFRPRLMSEAVQLASISLSLAAAVFLWQSRHLRPPDAPPQDVADGLQQIWDEFRNLFGIVWARRVLERLNQFAVSERWPVRLELTGFVPVDQLPEAPASDRLVLRRICWLMGRFVDRQWLEARLGPLDDDKPAVE